MWRMIGIRMNDTWTCLKLEFAQGMSIFHHGEHRDSSDSGLSHRIFTRQWLSGEVMRRLNPQNHVHLDSNHDEHDSPNIYQTFPHHSPNMILWCNQHLLPCFFPKCQGVDFARAHFPASSPPDFPRHLRPWNRPSPCNARWSCAWQWLHRSWCSHFGCDKSRRFFIGKSNEKHHPTLVIGEVAMEDSSKRFWL